MMITCHCRKLDKLLGPSRCLNKNSSLQLLRGMPEGGQFTNGRNIRLKTAQTLRIEAFVQPKTQAQYSMGRCT
jgi:hypothetical protein